MTDYYVDFEIGNDLSSGTTIQTSWATLDQFTENVRSAGDKVIVRRNMVQPVSSDLLFTSDGAIGNPIIMEADYDDDWGDFSNSVQNYTLVWGSKNLIGSAAVTGISSGMCVYNSTDGDDPREFSYEVSSISDNVVILKLPFKGSTGSVKNLKVMNISPIWNTAAGAFELDLNSDHYWKFQGMHFRGTDPNGVLEIDSARYTEVYDCIFTGNGVGDVGIRFSDDNQFVTRIEKSVFINTDTGGVLTNSSSLQTGWIYIRNCLAENCSIGFAFDTGSRVKLEDCEIDTATDGFDINNWTLDIFARNIIFTSVGGIVDTNQSINNPNNDLWMDDVDGTVGDSRFFNYLGSGDDIASYQSEITTVRSGGGDSSIKVIPGLIINTDQDFTMLKVFEYPIYASTDSKTYTVYFKTNATGNWTTDPTNLELYIEAEYYFSSSVADKLKTISTGLVDFNGSTDWQSLDVTVAPAQAGVLILRCWYGKPKEAGKSNEFFVDTKPVIS